MDGWWNGKSRPQVWTTGRHVHGPQALVPPCRSLRFGKASGTDQRREVALFVIWTPSTMRELFHLPVGRNSNFESILGVSFSNCWCEAHWILVVVLYYDVLSRREPEYYWLLRSMIGIEVRCRTVEDLDIILSGGWVLVWLLQGLEGEEDG